MKVYEAIADALIQEGVDVVFTLIDDPILSLVQELLEKNVRIVSARHEQAAVAMADGFARSNGRLGVCAIGAGPAIAQTGAALVTARRNRSPVLVLAGETPRDLRHHVKSFDQEGFIRATAGSCFALRDASGAGGLLAQALRHVRAGGGPAVMSLPSNLLESDVLGTWDYRSHPGVSLKAFPDPAAVERAAKLLTTAMRPVLLAGGGAVASGARESLERLANRTGALLATTMQAREWFRGHPRDLGLMGSFATARARDFFSEADLLVAIGTSLNPYIQGTAYGPGGRLAAKAKVIQIDRDPDRISDYQRVELGIVGDAKASVDAILDRLDADCFPGPERAWNVEGGAAELPTSPRSASTSRPAIRDFLEALDPLLPAERTVVVDCGLFVFSLVDQIHCAPESFVWTMNFGSLGMALPMGIGAAVARPNRPCFVFVGDGGFTMSPQELITATNHGIPLTVVILDDGGYGAEAHILKSRQKPLGLAALTNPDLGNVARSMGAEAVTVRNLGDLRQVERLIGEKRSRPLVIHALVERDAVHRAVP